MADKGLLSRDESSRSHIYEPRLEREHTQRQLMRDLVERAFSGSASGLVMSALTDKPVDPDELAEIRRLLDALEGCCPQALGRVQLQSDSHGDQVVEINVTQGNVARARFRWQLNERTFLSRVRQM